MVEDYLRELAERQGLERGRARLSADAARPTGCFQGRLLERIFSHLQAVAHRPASGADRRAKGRSNCSRPSRTSSATRSRTWTSRSRSSTPCSATGSALPVRLQTEDIEIHRTRNTPKCATVVLMDMSGSMRYDGQYINVKRMALALDGLIRREYPGDFLQFIEMYTFAKPRRRARSSN